jgi:hypothetical protein
LIGPYETPHAFRAALESHLRNAAREHATDLDRLRRRVAFERLLARLFQFEDPPWLLKGGYALELRLKDMARSTLDLDMSVPHPEHLRPGATEGEVLSQAHLVYQRLRQSAQSDLGDGFVFLIKPPRQESTGAPAGGLRCSVEARLSGRVFARFHLDVGLGDPVLGRPEWVKGLALLEFAGIPPARIALYPMAQQLAEKIHAYTFPWRDRDNTRVKDLVDMVLLLDAGEIQPELIKGALVATFEVRGTHPLPDQLPEPPADWAEPYAALDQELGLPAPNLEEAYAFLSNYWRGLRRP